MFYRTVHVVLIEGTILIVGAYYVQLTGYLTCENSITLITPRRGIMRVQLREETLCLTVSEYYKCCSTG